ncbi:MAG: pyridoxamine 5'-phosphate oxidase family protein [Eubacteriales bacterium]|nr:pyridoxamine 5'-phosphate oxidase family protein [Eubacteriales bacterium]
MDSYQNALTVMNTLFAKDYQFALATTHGSVPSLRYVDACYIDGYFYVVTYATSQKAREIADNPSVALCSRTLYSFRGSAENIGHPLKPENQAIRARLINAFEPWYFRHNDEGNESMCYLRITPETGFFHLDGTGYEVDFQNRTAKEFPFSFDMTLTQE